MSVLKPIYLFAALYLIMLTAACSTSRPTMPTVALQDVSKLSDQQLAVYAGSALRRQFRGEPMVDSDWAAIDRAQALGRLTPENRERIRRGFVYLGMPQDELVMSVDGLRAVETALVREHELNMYFLPRVSADDLSFVPYLLTCNDRLVAFFAAGVSSPTLSQGVLDRPSNQFLVQTNFASDFDYFNNVQVRYASLIPELPQGRLIMDTVYRRPGVLSPYDLAGSIRRFDAETWRRDRFYQNLARACSATASFGIFP